MWAWWICDNKHLIMGAPASHVLSVRYKSKVRAYRRPSQVQLMRDEFLGAALYWAEVVSLRLGAIAEKNVSQHCCVRGSVWVRQPVHQKYHYTAVRACVKKNCSDYNRFYFPARQCHNRELYPTSMYITWQKIYDTSLGCGKQWNTVSADAC